MYKFLNSELTTVVHLPTSRCIYLDQPAMIHSETYLAWAAEGNTAAAYVAPPVIPIDPKPVLLAQLASLDAKRIRPLAEGDVVYLAVLNKQAVDLRAKLQGLK